jgi:hypothetical protein
MTIKLESNNMAEIEDVSQMIRDLTKTATVTEMITTAIDAIPAAAKQIITIPLYAAGVSSAVRGKNQSGHSLVVIGMSAWVQARVTTTTVDVLDGAVSVLSAPLSIAAANTLYTGTMATSPPTIADDDEFTVTLVGTNTTGLHVLLFCEVA